MSASLSIPECETVRAGRDATPERVVVMNDISVMNGGAAVIALTSARLLAERGIPVTFMTGETSLDPPDLPFDVVAFGAKNILDRGRLGGALDGMYNRAVVRSAAQWIAKNDTPRTLYHLHNWTKVFSPAIFRALRPVAHRLVISAHDFFLTCPNGAYFNYREKRPCELRPMSAACLTTQCDRRNYAHKTWRSLRQGVTRAFCDLGGIGAIHAVHEGIIPLLARGGAPPAAVRVLRNPVTPWRSARVEAEANHIFLFVGRIEEDKGVDLLAEAATSAGVSLRMIGEGARRSALAAGFPAITFTGWKSRAEIAALIDDVRVLVVPSRWRETFGLAALEALTSGVPVLISPYPMIAPELAEQGLALTCDPHDREAFISALKRLASNDDLVAAMSRKAHAEARRLAPGADDWVEGLLQIYQEILQRKMP